VVAVESSSSLVHALIRSIAGRSGSTSMKRWRESSAMVAPRGVMLVLGSSAGDVGPLWCGCGVGSLHGGGF
jgi:hypothetical protein